MNIDQDHTSLSGLNDANQATPIEVSGLAVYDVAWASSAVGARMSSSCVETAGLFGAWWGVDGTDQSGNGRDGSLVGATLSSSGAPGCANASVVAEHSVRLFADGAYVVSYTLYTCGNYRMEVFQFACSGAGARKTIRSGT